MARRQPAATPGARARQEARIRRAMRNDKLATGILAAIVGVVMAIVVAMVVYILFQGVGQLFQPGFLTEASRSNGTEGGIAYQLFDSFYLLILTLIISLPISLFGAVFLVEYAPEGPVTKIASTAIETLSSLPSIVVGMFGFLMFSVNFGWGYSLISGAIALTMFNIPISDPRHHPGARGRSRKPARRVPGHGPHPLGDDAARPHSSGHARHRHGRGALCRPRVW